MSDDEEVQPLSKRINRLNIDHAAAAVAAAANKATDRPPSQNSLQSQAHWYVLSLKNKLYHLGSVCFGHIFGDIVE